MERGGVRDVTPGEGTPGEGKPCEGTPGDEPLSDVTLGDVTLGDETLGDETLGDEPSPASASALASTRSGLRTATAQWRTPRIITPSSTAWPPSGASR